MINLKRSPSLPLPQPLPRKKNYSLRKECFRCVLPHLRSLEIFREGTFRASGRQEMFLRLSETFCFRENCFPFCAWTRLRLGFILLLSWILTRPNQLRRLEGEHFHIVCLILQESSLELSWGEGDRVGGWGVGRKRARATSSVVWEGHLRDLSKCQLNRGCPPNRGLTINIQRLLCIVTKFRVVKKAKEAVLYFVQDF